jgi:hypothetical protein
VQMLSGSEEESILVCLWREDQISTYTRLTWI